jgi:hypothetical protein
MAGCNKRLSASRFRTPNDARCTLAVWSEEYNCERPHSSQDCRSPQEFKIALEGIRAMVQVPSATTIIKTTENRQIWMVKMSEQVSCTDIRTEMRR